MEDEYDVLGGYLPIFVQHLNDSRARLGLRIDSQDSEEINAERRVEADAEPHALSNWTSTEQDAFFRAVSVHSRWRPDLIAACVPTKTEWEVWMYLEALEEGAAALSAQDDDEDVIMEGRDVEMQVDEAASDSRCDSGSDMEDEELCKPALEVSQDWIDAEEHMATWITDGERHASLRGGAVTSTAEDQPLKRGRGRPLGSGKGGRARAKRRKASNSPSPIRRSPSPEPTSTSPQRFRNLSTGSARERETLMECLEVPHLLVLDSILRGGAGVMNDRSESRGGSIIVATLTEDGDDGEPRASDGGVSGLSDRIIGPSNVSESPSNVVIDPKLLALSGGADPAGRQFNQMVNESVPVQGSSSLPDASSSGTGNLATFAQDNATLEAGPNVNAESELLLLSPRSRRRVQKRLYMRRKRALLRGDKVASEGAGMAKLKPGRKARTEGSESLPTALPRSETPSGSAGDRAVNVRRKNNPGLTLPYKLRALFAKLGVDREYLRDQGMDLLNLGALGRLMGLYASIERDGEEADESAIAESVSANLIQHLQAGMVSFVTDVIYRAIVWREREIRLKQRNLAWRQGDQMTIGAVEHAVEAIGARYHSHKAYLKSLEARHGPSTTDALDPSVDPVVGAGDVPAELRALSTHRRVYMPLVLPPSAWKLSSLACLTRTYEGEATRTRRGVSAEIDEDELIPDEMDDEAEEDELAEEEEVDEADMAASATHEEELWDKIKK